MKLSGILPPDAYKAFQNGLEGRSYKGLNNKYTRYARPHHIRTLRGAGYIDGQLKGISRADLEGVVSHFVSIKHTKSSISKRKYTLVMLFEELRVVGLWTVPSEVFLMDSQSDDGNDDGEEEPPRLRNCPVDICFIRGIETECRTIVNMVPEDQECPDSQAGCPGTACVGGSGDDGDDGPPTTSTDIGQVLGM